MATQPSQTKTRTAPSAQPAQGQVAGTADLTRHTVVGQVALRFGIDPHKLLTTLKATAFKQREGSPPVTDEQMVALLVVANQYKLNPFTRQIFAFPDKQNGIVPVVSVDGWLHLINGHEQFDGLEYVWSDEIVEDLPGAKPCPAWCEVQVYRKDRSRPTVIREYLDEVFRPPFKGKSKDSGREYTVDGPWQSHTKRMLRWKTTIQGARIAFGLGGIFDEDEAERIVQGSHEVERDRPAPMRQQIRTLPQAGPAPTPAPGPSQDVGEGEPGERRGDVVAPSFAEVKSWLERAPNHGILDDAMAQVSGAGFTQAEVRELSALYEARQQQLIEAGKPPF